MMGDETPAIKTMKLYSNVDSIYNELKELGYSEGDPLKVEDLYVFDQYHYHGVKAVDHAIEKLNISSSSRALDIGAGLGGPARYMASKTKCHVTAVELQSDLNDVGADLTRRCDLADHVTHVSGDFLQLDIDALGQYDVIVTWLAICHIHDKKTLFDRCCKALKPGGKLFIEDFFLKNPLADKETEFMKTEAYVEDIPSKDEFLKQLHDSGFECEFEDCTDSSTEFVAQRVPAHQADRERYSRVYGQQVFQEQEHFFAAMKDLFIGGNLGGCKVAATKKIG